MADLNSRKDLLTSLPFSERRLESIERQLAVPRTNVSVVATSESTTSSTAVSLATADTVTVVTSAVCLIHIYFEVLASTTAGTLSVYVRDHDAANGVGVDIPYAQTASATPSPVTPSNVAAGVTVPYGNYLTFANTAKWDVAADNHTFSLRYSTTAGTATFYDRKLFAWVQPF